MIRCNHSGRDEQRLNSRSRASWPAPLWRWPAWPRAATWLRRLRQASRL